MLDKIKQITVRALPVSLCLVILLLVNNGCHQEKPASLGADSMLLQASDIPFIGSSPEQSHDASWEKEDDWIGLNQQSFGDLDTLVHKGQIRALVPYSPTYYYIDGRQQVGIAYQMLTLYEKELNKKYRHHAKVRIVFIPVAREQIIPLLNRGYGDIGVAGITITPRRKKQVDFSRPTATGLKEIVVGGPASSPIKSTTQLAGKEVYVHANSSYHTSLKKLNYSLRRKGLRPVRIRIIDPYLEQEDILEMVNAGIIRYTVMENDFVRYWSKVYKKLRPYPVCLKNHISFGWVFRKHSPQLKKSINAFLAHNGRRTLNGNYIYNKYVRTGSPLRHLASHKALKRLQKNRDLFVKHAKKYKLDWVLLAAQGYQESRLNSDKISVDGAVGIMQIKPSTARSKEVNIPDIYNNNNNIRAGAKYMHFLIAQYFNDKSISPMNKGLFALAAYNAGPTRIQYLRKRAAAYGINPNEWFNQVEIMVARDVGKETVQYVSNVYKYYISFRALKHYSKMSGKVVI